MAICINATFALDVNKIENHHGYFLKILLKLQVISF